MMGPPGLGLDFSMSEAFKIIVIVNNLRYPKSGEFHA